jgi:hypothetical protein
MVIRDFHVVSIWSTPNEADSVLIVDSYAVLPLPVTVQLFQPISGWNLQVIQREGTIKHGQFAPGYAGWRPAPRPAGSPDFRRLFVGETPDHLVILT